MALPKIENINPGVITDKVRTVDERLAKSDSRIIRSKITDIGLFLLVLVTALISYGDVEFSVGSFVNITLITVLIYIATTVVHHTKYDGGLIRGKQSDEYNEARKNYDDCVREIYQRGLATSLPAMCRQYVADELENHRRNLLEGTFISYEEYTEKYAGLDKKEIKKKKELSDDTKKLIIDANATRPLNLSAYQLLCPEGTAKRRTNVLGISSSEKRNMDFKINMAGRFLTTLLAGCVAVSFAADPSWEALAQWASRMFPLIVGYVTGYNVGYMTGAVTAVMYLDNQTEKLRAMLAGKSEKPVCEAETAI